MVVPKGYQETELGIIPQDWKVKTWGDVADGFISGATPYRAISHFFKGDLKWVSSGELNYNTIYDTIEHISIEAKQKSNLRIHPVGTFLMAITGLEAAGTRGSCALLGCNATTNQSCMAIYGTKELDVRYLFYYYIKNGNKLALEYCQGTKQQSYTARIVKKLPILVPLLKEQEYIATSLSDIDKYLLALENLIQKKRDVKRGTMQELLTGKKRLSGFTTNWIEKSLDELFNFSGGLSASRDMLSTIGYCYLHYGDIHSAHKTYIDINKDYHAIPKLNIDLRKVSNSSLLSDGDVVFVDASEDDEGASRHVIIRNNQGLPFLAGLHTIVAKEKSKELSHLYREYCFQTKRIKDQFKYFAAGTKVTGISKTNIAKIKLKFPADMAEQQAIATILSDMDTEIESLTQKLEKCRQIKQGMMQELLTGRIRLVDTASKKQRKEKKVSRAKPTVQPQGHNEHFHEAVILSAVVSLFASEKYPLGRFRRQKLAYLLHRHAQESTQGFLKKAAGPYNPTIRYKDEKIALKAEYVAERGNGKFVKGEKTNEAVNYFVQWYGAEAIEWLKQFQFRKNDELEVLTTVAEAIADLKRNSLPITVESVKQVIQANPEWRPKLGKDYFNDINIQAAMRESQKLFA